MSDANHEGPVRVRFAPSPTGPLHIGGARTALFNWLFARHHGGVFVLRIEDTDRKRYSPAAVQDFIDGLHWLGLDWDEGPEVGGPYGPYFQSERSALYQEWAAWLVENDRAYRCFCTPEELAARRAGKGGGYDRRCRYLTPEARAEYAAQGRPFVVRFKMPLEGETVIDDLIRGPIRFQNDQLQDLVLLKSDGYPTYHLANVVDDHFMRISHILRADEWIPTAPVHSQLYRAFGWEMPRIAHLPVILNPNGKGKLSKRTQAFNEEGQQILVQLREFHEAGHLPEALVNFLTNIGWSFGDDREVFSVEETIPRFTLDRINPAGGRFPYEKLEWLDGQWMQRLDPDDLARRLRRPLEDAGYEVNMDVLRRAVPLLQPRLKTLNDVVDWVGFLFAETFTPPEPAALIPRKMDAASTRAALEAAHDALAALPEFDAGAQEAALRQRADELGVKPGQLFGAVRMAVTGQQVSPPLFETMEIIGRATCLARIKAASESLAEMAEAAES
ncbi:MAG: glutamate--tRNA ligase [Anaerolineae bacterium]